nr:AP-1 complex subunit sigma-1 [Tanacetum cinerariifolium]
MCINQEDNELEVLEIIHHYVEILDRYFGSVCELDLIFNFHKRLVFELGPVCTMGWLVLVLAVGSGRVLTGLKVFRRVVAIGRKEMS